MTLRLDDKWIWDFWHVRDGADHHLFYLQAPRSLGDPELRHWNASIGHAVSSDLEHWTTLPDALHPGELGAWDDLTTWTGSIVEHGGRWNLLYTGTSLVEDGLIQRIGLATSADLVQWERWGPEPVLEADPRWYELLDLTAWHDQAWRDPWVVPEPGGGFRAYLTARAQSGDVGGRGVIGLARSDDLVHWEVLPPVTKPMGIGQLEVPQLVAFDDRYHLLFCTDGGVVTSKGTGTYALVGETPDGPFPAESLYAVEADPTGKTYAGKIVETGDGPGFLAWQGRNGDGSFVGAIAPPRRVVIRDRRIHVVGSPSERFHA